MSLARQFVLTVIAFALVTCSLLSAEQQTGNRDVPHIGYLGLRPLTESGSMEMLAGLKEGLRDLGQ